MKNVNNYQNPYTTMSHGHIQIIPFAIKIKTMETENKLTMKKKKNNENENTKANHNTIFPLMKTCFNNRTTKESNEKNEAKEGKPHENV